MALVKCSACGGQISEQAMACPHCGHPAGMGSRRTRSVIALLIGLLVAGIGVFGALYESQPGGGGAPPMVVWIVGGLVVLMAVVVLVRVVLPRTSR